MGAVAGKPVFVPPGTQKLAEAPTRAAGAAMMRKLKQALEVCNCGRHFGVCNSSSAPSSGFHFRMLSCMGRWFRIHVLGRTRAGAGAKDKRPWLFGTCQCRSCRIVPKPRLFRSPYQPLGTVCRHIGRKRSVPLDVSAACTLVPQDDWEGAEIGIFENEHDCWVVSLGAAHD